ncbi:M48 family metalloprotease [Ochrovirga pacifica]|uniref:hypothetical protein n=1 Tax=Ochrovirga pacifica TaxID=1042376 RepID=UPI0002557757|nr:hypothetical protein [Ochrovirga pacifica]
MYFNYLIGTLTVLMLSCQNTTTSEETVVEDTPPKEIQLSAEAQLKELYRTQVIPLFTDFTEVSIPTIFKIDKKDPSINAGASFGYVEVSQGLIDVRKTEIQRFALAHELAHIVTISQAKKFGLSNVIPKGLLYNEYQKAEFLADLIAIHLIQSKQPQEIKNIQSIFPQLQILLGGKTFTHPSGRGRIQNMQLYLQEAKHISQAEAFKKQFQNIWSKN